MEKWWLWEWTDDQGQSREYVKMLPSGDERIRCTEVRLMPVDAVVCEKGSREWAVVMAMRGKKVTHKTHLGNDDNPHWASSIVAHEDMGEWYELPAEEPVEKENPMDDGLVTLRVAPDSLEAAIAGTRRGERWADSKGRILEPMVGLASLWVKDKDRLLQQANLSLPWHRVEETLKCPACGAEMLSSGTTRIGVRMLCSDTCGVCGPWRSTESDAREAFRRMGGKR